MWIFAHLKDLLFLSLHHAFCFVLVKGFVLRMCLHGTKQCLKLIPKFQGYVLGGIRELCLPFVCDAGLLCPSTSGCYQRRRECSSWQPQPLSVSERPQWFTAYSGFTVYFIHQAVGRIQNMGSLPTVSSDSTVRSVPSVQGTLNLPQSEWVGAQEPSHVLQFF